MQPFCCRPINNSLHSDWSDHNAKHIFRRAWLVWLASAVPGNYTLWTDYVQENVINFRVGVNNAHTFNCVLRSFAACFGWSKVPRFLSFCAYRYSLSIWRLFIKNKFQIDLSLCAISYLRMERPAVFRFDTNITNEVIGGELNDFFPLKIRRLSCIVNPLWIQTVLICSWNYYCWLLANAKNSQKVHVYWTTNSVNVRAGISITAIRMNMTIY